MTTIDMTVIDKLKYIVCCPLRDNEKCVRTTDKCEAEQWKKQKIKEIESEGRYDQRRYLFVSRRLFENNGTNPRQKYRYGVV